MKAQHRHELQTNELADKLGVYLQRMKPYSRQIGLGAVAVVVVVVALLVMNNQRLARAGAGWSDYFQAFAERDPKALAEVARLHAGSKAAIWAEQAAGDVLLATGAGQMFSDREEAEKSLRDAEKHFQAVEQTARDPMLRTRAQYGLAQVFESLAQTEKACEYYDKVYRANMGSALGRAAKQRMDDLSKDSLQGWYAWFERQEPPQPESGAGGLEPEVPDDLGTLPSRPDLSFPGDLMPPSETPAEPAPAEPAGEEKPAGEPPALNPPAQDASNPESAAGSPAEPPAEEKPAAESPAEPPAAKEPPVESPAEPPTAEEPPADEKPSGEPPAAADEGADAAAKESSAAENPAEGPSAESGAAEPNPSP